MDKIYEIIKYFPINIYNILLYTFDKDIKIGERVQEIRIRANRPILLRLKEADILLDYIVNRFRNITNFRKNL